MNFAKDKAPSEVSVGDQKADLSKGKKKICDDEMWENQVKVHCQISQIINATFS